ncbi:MAG: DUF362 domain-containing protein [Prolixibacteraceae bacterium]|jgi:hypothetical protein|nr:DUF362 domain-containing protein [Prolixibacteraceae bacterium]
MIKNSIEIFKKYGAKAIFLVTGFGSLIWFLVRVIPKPSRAAYPCMRTALPLASSLVVYLIGLGSFTMLMRKAKDRFQKAKYLISVGLAVAGLLVGFVTMVSYNIKLNANPLTETVTPNEVHGVGTGIYPGRVVWIHSPKATNENSQNQDNDYWYMDKNTNQEIVSAMLSNGLQLMTGKSNDTQAWDALLKYFNKKTGNGDKGYTEGEKFVIKTNNNGVRNGDNCINTSPQITYAILDQLVNVVGVNQTDISIGDPNCTMPAYTYDHCSTDFPNVNFWGENASVEPVANSFYASDGSTVDALPQSYIDAAYMINIPILKKHHRSGISICCKNHFGSIAPFTGGAWHLHPSLPCPEASGIAENGDYGSYRCFVDIMGHKDLGGKTVLNLVDALWGSVNWGHPAVKYSMTPFNNDWPSSLFLSQDPVAIESVCFDFLYEEFDEDHPTEGGTPDENKGPFPHFAGVDDYLQQAADPDLWAVDYDPENDGTILESLGANEHWNNAIDKQYSRNLGRDAGIELFKKTVTSVDDLSLADDDNNLVKNYPNPFSDFTTINYHINTPGEVTLNIYTINGKLVYKTIQKHYDSGSFEYVWNGSNSDGNLLSNGNYILNLNIDNKITKSQKLTINR